MPQCQDILAKRDQLSHSLILFLKIFLFSNGASPFTPTITWWLPKQKLEGFCKNQSEDLFLSLIRFKQMLIFINKFLNSLCGKIWTTNAVKNQKIQLKFSSGTVLQI